MTDKASALKKMREAIGHVLQQARRQADLKVETVGDFMGGVSASLIQQMERGERPVGLDRIALAKLVAVHDKDAERFVTAFDQGVRQLLCVEDHDPIQALWLIAAFCVSAAQMAKADVSKPIAEERRRA